MKALFIALSLVLISQFSCAFGEEQQTDQAAIPIMQEAARLTKDDKRDEATALFEKSLNYKLSPKHEAMVRATLGSLYAAKHDLPKSLELLKRAHELDP